MCITKIFHFFVLGLIPGPKFAKIGDDLLPTQVYHPAKFHRPVSTYAGDIRYKTFADKDRNTQTENDKSPPCLSACGDNKKRTQATSSTN